MAADCAAILPARARLPGGERLRTGGVLREGKLAGEQLAHGLAGFVLDDLAAINARHGYAAGDRVIRQVGLILARLARAEDLVARLGGDEFVVLLPDTGDRYLSTPLFAE